MTLTVDERYARISKLKAEIDAKRAAGQTENTIAGIEDQIRYQKRKLIEELGAENVTFDLPA